jgi:hypothetical protein
MRGAFLVVVVLLTSCAASPWTEVAKCPAVCGGEVRVVNTQGPSVFCGCKHGGWVGIHTKELSGLGTAIEGVVAPTPTPPRGGEEEG